MAVKRHGVTTKQLIHVRKKLKKLFQDMMINPQCPVSLIPIIHERYSTVEPDEEKRIIEIAEVIADIREPITVVDTPRINEDNRARELKVLISVN